MLRDLYYPMKGDWLSKLSPNDFTATDLRGDNYV
jgi:hypothetical protein